jgi:Protein kinase domain
MTETTRDWPDEPGQRRPGPTETTRDPLWTDGTAETFEPAPPPLPRQPATGDSPPAQPPPAFETTRDATPVSPAQPPPVGGAEPFLWQNLPPPLARRFRAIQNMPAGGEADLLLAQPLDGAPGPVVIKLYRGDDLDGEALAAVRAAPHPALVRSLEWGAYQGRSYEIMEYLPGGSLAELMADRRPWTADAALPLLDQVAAALAHLHALHVVHRDVKPQNLLLRSRVPLSLALADFGLARTVVMTRELRTRAMTLAYAAPEAVGGETSAALDWWALGVILLQLLTGAHPFERSDGQLAAPNQIIAWLVSRQIDVTAVPDGRWQLLLAGLLTSDPTQRWGADQVRRWRAGESPAVARSPGATSPAAARSTVDGFVVGGHECRTGPELAAAMSRDWADGYDVLAGRAARSDLYRDFRRWLTERGLTTALSVVDQTDDADRTLVRLLTALDPDRDPIYQGYLVDTASLVPLAVAAQQDGGTGPASAVVASLREHGTLPPHDGLRGCVRLAELDQQWQGACARYDRAVAELSGEYGAPLAAAASKRVAWASLLAASASSEAATELAARAANAHAQAEDHSAYREVLGSGQPLGTDPARNLLTLQLATVAEDAAAQIRLRGEGEARQRTLTAGERGLERARGVDRFVIRLALLGIAPSWLIGYHYWRPRYPPPSTLPAPMRDLAPSGVVLPDLMAGAAVVFAALALILARPILRRGWRGRGGKLRGAAFCAVLAVGLGLGASPMADRYDTIALRNYDTKLLPAGKIVPYCAGITFGVQDESGAAWRVAARARTDANGVQQCDQLVAYRGYRPRWTRHLLGRNESYTSGLGYRRSAVMTAHDATGRPYLLGVTLATGRPTWRFHCPGTGGNFLVDGNGSSDDYGASSPPTQPGTLSVDCGSRTYTIDPDTGRAT